MEIAFVMLLAASSVVKLRPPHIHTYYNLLPACLTWEVERFAQLTRPHIYYNLLPACLTWEGSDSLTRPRATTPPPLPPQVLFCSFVRCCVRHFCGGMPSPSLSSEIHLADDGDNPSEEEEEEGTHAAARADGTTSRCASSAAEGTAKVAAVGSGEAADVDEDGLPMYTDVAER